MSTSRRLPLTPDQLAAAAFLLSLLGELVIPIELLPALSLESAGLWVGLIIALAGLATEIAVASCLHRAGTTTKPRAAPTTLVTTGPFRWSRNPFYLGLLLVLAGVMIILSLDWATLTIPLLWLGLDRMVIPNEEANLARQFAIEWDSYRAVTRRWL